MAAGTWASFPHAAAVLTFAFRRPHNSRAAPSHSPYRNSNSASSSRRGTTRRLFSTSSDSVRISQVNQSVSISPHLLISGQSLQHSISLQAGLQSLKNFNEKQSGGDFTSTSASLIYALLFPVKKISITNVFNYFNTALNANKTELMGYNLAVSKILKGHLPTENTFISSITLSLNGGYFMNWLNGASAGSTIMLNPSVSLAFLKRNSFQLMANYTNTDNKNTSGNNRNFMIAARYNLSF